MDKDELFIALTKLFQKYVGDTTVLRSIDKDKMQYQVKGLLAELDKLKKRDYDKDDIEVMKDIYYYYG